MTTASSATRARHATPSDVPALADLSVAPFSRRQGAGHAVMAEWALSGRRGRSDVWWLSQPGNHTADARPAALEPDTQTTTVRPVKLESSARPA